MLRARDAMDRDYAKPLDIPTLARIAFVSEAHFIRTFRATFGETPHRYLQRRRVERAMFLLRETDLSVTEICLEVGFAQPRQLRPDLPRDRGRIADDVPLARRPTCARCRRASRKRGRDRAVLEKPASGPRASVRRMLTQITHSQVYVLDQDEALDFYVGKLGLEVNTDADLGFMRWLTVNVPGDPERQILLEKPGPPVARRRNRGAGPRARDQGCDGRSSDLHRGRHPQDLRGAARARASSSPRSRPSATTAPTAACATRSATTSASAS